MEEASKSKQLTVRNDINELYRVTAFLEELWEEWHLPARLMYPINLVVEEAFTNIVFYAFNDEKTHRIGLECILENNTLTITTKDEGKAFDPTTTSDPDTSLPVEDRPIGGLGIYLIKQFMNEVRYERVNNKNCLIMVLNLDQTNQLNLQRHTR